MAASAGTSAASSAAGVGTGAGGDAGAGCSDTAPALLLPLYDASEAPQWDNSEYIVRCPATVLAIAIRQGHITSAKVTASFLDRIHAVNPIINAVVELNPRALQVRLQPLLSVLVFTCLPSLV